MADHPFANAGLGMFGTAEKQFAQSAMHPSKPKEGGDILGNLLAAFLKGSNSEESQPSNIAIPQAIQYEPNTQFPEIFRQQYVSPYKPGWSPEQKSPVVPPNSATSLQGFVAPRQYGVSTQAAVPGQSLPGLKTSVGLTGSPQVQSVNQYSPLTNQIWGNIGKSE